MKEKRNLNIINLKSIVRCIKFTKDLCWYIVLLYRKRRRGSGTSTRRRTRTNSGGSDIFIQEENALTASTPVTDADVVSISDTIVEAVSVTPTTTTCSTVGVLTPVLSDSPTSPAVLKTKRVMYIFAILL